MGEASWLKGAANNDGLCYKIDILSMPGHDVVSAEIARGPHGTICENQEQR